MDQILAKETHGWKEIERRSYAEVLTNEKELIKRVDQFNTDWKNITLNMKNITDNRRSMRKKKLVESRNWFVWVMFVFRY